MADIQAQSTGGQLAVEIQAPRIGTTVDFATLLGVGGAFVMIAGAMMLSGQAAAFLDVPSILIVVGGTFLRSEEHTSELQSLMRISYAVFCLKKKNNNPNSHTIKITSHEVNNTTQTSTVA